MTARERGGEVTSVPIAPSSGFDETAGGGSDAIGLLGLAVYLLLGTIFGFVLTRGEVISWFRIQEMFRFQGFHMYGVFAGALAVSIPSMWALRTGRLRTLSGEPITIPPKERTPRSTRYWAGGTLFGVGWAFTGACPGPLYALFGSGSLVFIVPILTAVLGAWAYAGLRPRLPH